MGNQHLTYEISRSGCHFSLSSVLLTLTEATAVGILGSYVLFIITPCAYVSPNDLDLSETSVLLMFWVVIVVNVVLLMHVRHMSLNLLSNTFFTILLYVPCVKIITLFSIDIRFAFELTMTWKGLMVVIGCTSVALSVSLLFKTVEWKYIASATGKAKLEKNNSENQLRLENSRFPIEAGSMIR